MSDENIDLVYLCFNKITNEQLYSTYDFIDQSNLGKTINLTERNGELRKKYLHMKLMYLWISMKEFL